MKLYDELAQWWPLMSPPSEYEEEAADIARLLCPAPSPGRLRVLELGSGGGHLASHLKAQFDLTLLDRSPQMLELSRKLNPECRQVQGDMRNARLDEHFDAVLIFDAVSHLSDIADLRAALQTARAHLPPGGIGVFCPDWTSECFRAETTTGGSDGADRGMRYIEWTHPEIEGTVYTSDIVYLLLERGKPLRIEHDRVELGLFSRAQWLGLFSQVGFVAPQVHALSSRDVFCARAAG
jgi:SAM-dependent methyltransferase